MNSSSRDDAVDAVQLLNIWEEAIEMISYVHMGQRVQDEGLNKKDEARFIGWLDEPVHSRSNQRDRKVLTPIVAEKERRVSQSLEQESTEKFLCECNITPSG